jgi:RNA recognition motif-containing protein
MGRQIYVGNLAHTRTDGHLQEMFAAFGSVQLAQVVMDRDTGRSRGFGFVEMGTDQEAQAAIAGLHGKEVNGRRLTVNEARSKTDGGGGRRSGGGGYGGGRGRF